MYERSYGSKYAGYQSAAHIAKLIRGDIKAAIAAGELPGSPRNYRVHSKSYSGGQSVDVRVINMPGLFQECDGTVPGSRQFHVRSFDNPEHDITVNAEDWRSAITAAREWYKAPASERFGVGKCRSARSCPRHWCAGHSDMRDNPHAEHHTTLTVEGRRIHDLLDEIRRAYNHDGSDVMTDYFDVLYYGTVDIYEWDNEPRSE